VVRANLSKTRRKYFTFLPAEGCTFLKEYLEERARAGEHLAPESPVIAHIRPEIAIKPFQHTNKISDMIRDSMRRAGVRKRPYVLRAYAETQLIIAESKGMISHPYLQFVAGHAGDIEARYSTNKGRLPPDMVEEMREAYARCEPFLCTSSPTERTNMMKEAKLEVIRTIVRTVFGMDPDNIKFVEESELGRSLTKEEEESLYEKTIREKRERSDELMNTLFKDPEFLLVVEKKLREIRSREQG